MSNLAIEIAVVLGIILVVWIGSLIFGYNLNIWTGGISW